MYVGFVAVLANVVVAALVTLLCRALRAPDGVDRAQPDDYFSDEEARKAPPEAAEPEPVPAV